MENKTLWDTKTTPTSPPRSTRRSQKHKSHRVRLASSMSYAEVKKNLTGRRKEILATILSDGPATDRDVKDRLGLGDMNEVRPCITKMVGEGLLQEAGLVRCDTTNRLVRLLMPGDNA
jgi:hypothetical protein